MRSTRGFTLIELLVVISIIAVLAGMLLPAIGLVREAAKGSACGNNLRQVAMAFNAYADEQDGRFPPMNNSPSGSTDYQWYANLLDDTGILPVEAAAWGTGRYAGSAIKGVWRCPSLSDGLLKWGGGYGVLEDIVHGTSYQLSIVRSAVSRPSERALLADAERSDLTPPTYKSSPSLRCPVAVDWSLATSGRGAARHGRGQRLVAAFMDGHAQQLSYADAGANRDDLWRHSSP